MESTQLPARTLALLMIACSPLRPPTEVPASKAEDAADATPGTGAAVLWKSEIWSPQPTRVRPDLQALQDRCGVPDAALATAAGQWAGRPSAQDPDLDTDELEFLVRAAGSPYVWPRAWAARSRHGAFDRSELENRLVRWLSTMPRPGGERRCGMVLQSSDQNEVMVVIVADVFADLVKPLPTRARVGQWLDLDVMLLTDALDASLVLAGPNGATKTLPTSLHGRSVRSWFAVGGYGACNAQLLAVLPEGPRPVVQFRVQVGDDPPGIFRRASVPGENAGNGLGQPVDAIQAMLEAARRLEGRTTLVRDPMLDHLAQRHAVAMRDAGYLGHDVGDGSPQNRLQSAGISVARGGENVAHAPDARSVHRALWASPSHRANLLDPEFRRVGLGVARDRNRSLWVVQLFATLD